MIYEVTGNRKLVGAERRFVRFMREYGKEYSSREEYAHRLGVFARNLVKAAEHQALDPTAVHGVTPFMDLTQEEFESMYLGLRPGNEAREPVNGLGSGFEEAPRLDVSGLHESFDWREEGAVTDVKMQVC